jgi:hypothetical protein
LSSPSPRTKVRQLIRGQKMFPKVVEAVLQKQIKDNLSFCSWKMFTVANKQLQFGIWDRKQKQNGKISDDLKLKVAFF